MKQNKGFSNKETNPTGNAPFSPCRVEQVPLCECPKPRLLTAPSRRSFLISDILANTRTDRILSPTKSVCIGSRNSAFTSRTPRPQTGGVLRGPHDSLVESHKTFCSAENIKNSYSQYPRRQDALSDHELTDNEEESIDVGEMRF